MVEVRDIGVIYHGILLGGAVQLAADAIERAVAVDFDLTLVDDFGGQNHFSGLALREAFRRARSINLRWTASCRLQNGANGLQIVVCIGFVGTTRTITSVVNASRTPGTKRVLAHVPTPYNTPPSGVSAAFYNSTVARMTRHEQALQRARIDSAHCQTCLDSGADWSSPSGPHRCRCQTVETVE